MRNLVAVGLVFLCTACAISYDPEPVRLPVPLPGNSFDLALEVFRDRYRKIVEADRDTFRIQSAWIPMQRGDIPGFRRASVFRGADGQLSVIVEIYFVHLGPKGLENSDVRGDRRAEQELAGALEHAIGK